MDTLRAAIIGCGKAGSEYSQDVSAPGVYSHAHAYTVHPRTEAVAVCDTDVRKAVECGERWGAQPFADLGQLLAEIAPDVVSVCTPDATHVDVVRQVLDADCVRGVLCEKPLALTSDDAARVVDAALRRAVPLGVNYSRRFDQAFRLLRDDIAAGKLGRIQTVGGLYGKGLLHNGSHWFDLLRYLFGEASWVQAARTSVASYGADETLDCWVGMEAGFSAFLHGTDHEAYTVFEMDILGELGRVRMVDGGRELRYHETSDTGFVRGYRFVGDEPRLVREGLRDAMLGAVDSLVRSVDDGEPLACSGQDGLAAIRMVEGARASALTGERVWM